VPGQPSSALGIEIGIGAGWNVADYQKTGIPFEAAGTRVSRLVEALHIIKAFFSGGTVTFQGRHYQVSNLDAVPSPVQKPRPPVMLGGAGRRMLTLAAREADILNFPDRPSEGVSTAGNAALGLTFDQRRKRLEKRCVVVGEENPDRACHIGLPHGSAS